MRTISLTILPVLAAALSMPRDDVGALCAKTVPNCQSHKENWPLRKIQCCAKKNPDACMKARPEKIIPGVAPSATYCEVFSYRFAGDYVKFEGSECNAKDDCTLSIGSSVSVSDTWTVNGGLAITVPGPAKGVEAAFNVGASYAHTDTRTYTNTVTHSKKDKPYAKGHSGFWAHVPHYITSCGSISFVKYKSLACSKKNDCWTEWYGIEPGNRWCNDSPVKGKGGMDGKVIFITTNAITGDHLGPEHQSPWWRNINVRPARA